MCFILPKSQDFQNILTIAGPDIAKCILHLLYFTNSPRLIKQEESSKPFKIFYISKSYELIPDFVFADDEKGDVNPSMLSSY